MKHPFKGLTVTAFLFTVLLAGLILGAQVIRFYTFSHQPLITAEKGVSYIFPKGKNLRSLTSDLQKVAGLSHPFYFRVLAQIKGVSRTLDAGEYFFPQGTTPDQILTQMALGEVRQRKVTIVEGWTAEELLKEVKALPGIKHVLPLQDVKQMKATLGLPTASLEGMFYPDTYQYTYGDTDRLILERAYQAMQEQLSRVWQERDANLPYQSPYEVLIAASLIEREGALSRERPIISGVIKRRIEKGMPLQIDASVEYGLRKRLRGRPLQRKDLRIPTPYNTYLQRGLPPTPIALPSADALNAAVHPDDSKLLYYVARGDGSHFFSETLKNHNRAVLSFQKNHFTPRPIPTRGQCVMGIPWMVQRLTLSPGTLWYSMTLQCFHGALYPLP